MSRNFRLYTVNKFLDFPFFLYYFIYLFCFFFLGLLAYFFARGLTNLIKPEI